MENNYIAKKGRGKSDVFDCKNLIALITYLSHVQEYKLLSTLASVEKHIQIWPVISSYCFLLIH